MQCRFVALHFAFANTGSSMAARMAMMAITTSNSIKVNPARPRRDSITLRREVRGAITFDCIKTHSYAAVNHKLNIVRAATFDNRIRVSERGCDVIAAGHIDVPYLSTLERFAIWLMLAISSVHFSLARTSTWCDNAVITLFVRFYEVVHWNRHRLQMSRNFQR